MKVYPNDLQRVLTFLPRNRFLFLMRKVFPVPEGFPPFSPKAILLLSLYDWFAHLGGYITDDQQQRVVAKFDAELAAVADQDWRPVEKLPAVLTLSDGRYAAVRGRKAWYDYELDEDAEQLPAPAVTHISCDLTALQLRVLAKIKELRGGKDAATGRDDGPARRPPVGDRASGERAGDDEGGQAAT